MLGAGASRMAKSGSKRGKGRNTSKVLSARIPIADANRINAAAAAAGLTVSDYLLAAVKRQDLEYRPDLAALVTLMQIAARPYNARTILSDRQLEQLITALTKHVSAGLDEAGLGQ